MVQIRRSGELRGQVNTTNLLLCFWILPEPVLLFYQDALSSYKRTQPSGNTISMKGCAWPATMLREVVFAKVTSTQMAGYKVSQHHTSFAGLPSSHSVWASNTRAPDHPHDGKENMILQTRPPSLWSSSDANVPIVGGGQGSAGAPWLVFSYAAPYVTNCVAQFLSSSFLCILGTPHKSCSLGAALTQSSSITNWSSSNSLKSLPIFPNTSTLRTKCSLAPWYIPPTCLLRHGLL